MLWRSPRQGSKPAWAETRNEARCVARELGPRGGALLKRRLPTTLVLQINPDRLANPPTSVTRGRQDACEWAWKPSVRNTETAKPL